MQVQPFESPAAAEEESASPSSDLEVQLLTHFSRLAHRPATPLAVTDCSAGAEEEVRRVGNAHTAERRGEDAGQCVSLSLSRHLLSALNVHGSHCCTMEIIAACCCITIIVSCPSPARISCSPRTPSSCPSMPEFHHLVSSNLDPSGPVMHPLCPAILLHGSWGRCATQFLLRPTGWPSRALRTAGACVTELCSMELLKARPYAFLRSTWAHVRAAPPSTFG